MKKEWGKKGCGRKWRCPTSSTLLHLPLPRAHRPPSPSLWYPGPASALTGIAADARCRPRAGRWETHPFQREAPYQTRGRETVAAGPRASVSLPAHWSSRLEPGSGSQRSQRSPKLPRSPAAAAPQPTRLRARLAAAGSLRRRPRGGAEAGAGVGLPHVGGRGPGRRRCRLLRQAASRLPGAPPPPPPNGQTTRPPPPPLRSHDRPVPFGCARPSQVPPVRGLTLAAGRAGSSARSVPVAPAQPFPTAPLRRSWDPPSPPPAWSTRRDTWRGNLGPPFPPALPREGIHSPLFGTASAAVSETGHRPDPKGMRKDGPDKKII